MKQSVGEATLALHLQAYCLTPEQEYRFDPDRRWRFDFAWPDRKLAVEVDGGTWVQGRHNRGSSIEADYEKLNQAAIFGWRVLRFTTEQVTRGLAIDTILLAVSPEQRIWNGSGHDGNAS